MNVAGFHELIGGEALTSKFRLGSCNEQWICFGNQSLELSLAAFRVFSRVKSAKDGLEIFLERGTGRGGSRRGSFGIAADCRRLQFLHRPARALRNLPQVGARRHETDDDRVAEELELRVDGCQICGGPRMLRKDDGKLGCRFVHERTSCAEHTLRTCLNPARHQYTGIPAAI